MGRNLGFLMAQDTHAYASEFTDVRLNGQHQNGSPILYRHKNGNMFWAAVFVSPVMDRRDTLFRYSVTFVDLTEYKREQLESKILLDEMSHRSKNTMSIVQAIVWQSLQTAANPERARESIDRRLLALSRSQNLLTRQGSGSVGLCDIIRDALEPFIVTDGRANRIVISGNDIRVPARAAVALGYGFNELATNAVKYGAFSNEAGSIVIHWGVESTPEGNRLLLHWREKDGPPVTPPSRRGFGSTMLERGLAHELEATVKLHYTPTGLECTLTMPAPSGGDDSWQRFPGGEPARPTTVF
jgi:two-component sensor histidine kinase